MSISRNGVALTSNGITSITIIDGGSGYDPDNIEVIFSGGEGEGASGRADVENGSIVNVTISHCGKAYTSSPDISFTTGSSAVAQCTIGSDMLLRSGYCDFTQDSSFDPDNEAQHGDVPDDAVIVNNPFNPQGNVTTWNGNDWQLN